MGDICVDMFLVTLKNLIMSSNLDEKHQLQSFAEDIMYLRGFLKITEKKRYEHLQVMDLVMRIRDVVSETQDIVEHYVALVLDANHYPLEHHSHLSLDLDSFKGIKTLKAEAEQILGENIYDISGVAEKKLKHPSTGSEGIIGCSSSSGLIHTFKVGEEKVVVGFEDEARTLIERLGDSVDEQLEVISIIGARKTTLAKEVYDNPLTFQRFEIRAWVHVSQHYDYTMKKDMLISILESAFTGDHEDYRELSEDNLRDEVHECLRGKKYLIVMDGIWDPRAWWGIQRSLPREDKGCKVLLTCGQCFKLFGVHHVYHQLEYLGVSESWELLQEKVFKHKPCPPELVDIGMQIAKRCERLPFGIATIADILAREDKTIDVWEEAAKHLSSIDVKNKNIMGILELRYNLMPLHLKACFLYTGAFPKGYEIPVRELIWLWIAEGFIHQNVGEKSMEAIAEDYLTSLVKRNLLIVARKESSGTIKTCRVHLLQRKLCLKKVKEDNFFEQIYENESFSHSATKERRRLFVDPQFLKTFSSSPYDRNLRSFLCHRLPNSKPYFVDLSFFIENFEHLRVLHCMSATRIGEVRDGDLFHLRYLALSVPREHPLPTRTFRYLSNLEILNLDVERSRISLHCDIFKMVKLRHLYTRRGIFTYDHSSSNEDGWNMLESLQSFKKLCNCGSCLGFLKRTPNVRDLRLSGILFTESDVDLAIVDLEFLECLSILHLRGWNRTRTRLRVPPTLTQLSLRYTHLKWEELSMILQTLPSLEVLKLSRNSCSGPVWDTTELEGGFPELRCLRLRFLDIREWIASKDQFPRLEVLVIQNCDVLQGIPTDFANLNELREIKVQKSSQSAGESAREIKEKQINRKGDDDCINVFLTDNFNRNDESDSSDFSD